MSVIDNDARSFDNLPMMHLAALLWTPNLHCLQFLMYTMSVSCGVTVIVSPSLPTCTLGGKGRHHLHVCSADDEFYTNVHSLSLVC